MGGHAGLYPDCLPVTFSARVAEPPEFVSVNVFEAAEPNSIVPELHGDELNAVDGAPPPNAVGTSSAKRRPRPQRARQGKRRCGCEPSPTRYLRLPPDCSMRPLKYPVGGRKLELELGELPHPDPTGIRRSSSRCVYAPALSTAPPGEGRRPARPISLVVRESGRVRPGWLLAKILV